MNRIYKVIWSKVRNAYVVVSELAKNHGKEKCEVSTSHGSRLGAALLLSLVLGGGLMAGGVPAEAAAVNAGSTGSTSTSQKNNNTLAVGDNTIANGAGALAVGGGTEAYGLRAIAIAGGRSYSDYTISIGENSVAGGSYNYTQYSNALSGIATKAIAIGNSTSALGVNDVVIGANQTANTPNSAYYETANGNNQHIAVGGRVLVGHDNTATGRAANSVIVGSNNSSNSVHGIAIGQNAQVGEAAGTVGTTSKGVSSTLEYENTMAIGTNTRAYASNSIAIGNNAVAGNNRTENIDYDWNGQGAIALGENAQATAYYTVAVGAQSKANGGFAVALGREAEATSANTLATGYNAKATSTGTVANGAGAQATATNAMAAGLTAMASGQNSVAVGANSSASSSGGVALGSNSTSTRAAVTNSSGWNGQDSTWSSWAKTKDTSLATSGGVWNGTQGAVSIGTDGADGTTYTRQLTGVAAGTKDTDAVNMAQWKNTVLATVGDDKATSMTTTYGTDGAARNVTKVLNESLIITGAGDTARTDASDSTTKTLKKEALTSQANIGTVVSDNQIAIRLAKDLQGLDSVTTGSTVVNNSGITITPTSGSKVSLTQDGLNNGGKQITNVASGGDTGTNGANIDDVTRISQKNIKVQGGSNITVTDSTTDGVRTSSVALNNNVDLSADGSLAFGSTTDNTYVDKSGVITHVTNTDGTKVDATLSGSGLHVIGKAADGTTNSQVVADETGMVVGYETGDKANTLFDQETGTGKQKTSMSTKGVKVEGTTNLDTNGQTSTTTRKINTTLSEEGVNINRSQTLLQERGLTVGKDAEKTTAGQATVYRTGLNVTGSAVNDTAGKTATVTANGLTANGDTTGDKIATVTSEGMTVQADAARKKTATYDVSGVALQDTDSSKTNTVSVDGMNIQNGTSGAALTTTNLQLGMTNGTGGINLGNQAGGGANTAEGNYLTGLSNTAWDAKNIASGRAATEDQLKAVSDSISASTSDYQLVANPDTTDGKYTVSNGKVDLKVKDSVHSDAEAKTVTIEGIASQADVNTKTFGLTDDAGTAVTKTLDNTIQVKGGISDTSKLTTTDNIGVVANGTDGLKVRLAKDLKGLDSVTTGNTVINNSGLTITNNGKTVSLTDGGLNNGGNKITNVGKGDVSDTSTDAVNGSQLQEVKTLAGKHTKVTVEGGTEAGTTDYAGTNLKLKATTTDGQTTYDLKLGDDITVGQKGENGKDGSIGVNGKDGSSVVINGKDGSIGLNGKDGANGLTIKGADGSVGVDGTDGHDGKDGMTRIVYEDHNKVTHEVATLDDGLKFKGDDDTVIAKKLNTQMDITGGADKSKLTSKDNIGVNSTADGKLKVQLAKNLDLDADGSVTTGNTTINNGGITITSSGKTVSLTDGGLNNGGNKIANVANGENDTDAVNVAQLKKLQDTLTSSKIHYYSVKSTQTEAGSNYENDGAVGENSLAAGSYALAQTDSVSVGHEAQANDTRSVAIGTGAQTFSKADSQDAADAAGGNTAIGYHAQAGRTDEYGLATAVGKDTTATGWGSSAYGVSAEATGSWATAIGNHSSGTGEGSTVVGATATANEAYATAIGLGAKATAVWSLAAGYQTQAQGLSSVAIGAQAKATQAYSVVLGNGSTDRAATQETQGTIPLSDGSTRTYGNFAGSNPFGVVSIGTKNKERQIVNVAAGKISADSTDAVNGSQLYSLAHEVGTNASDINQIKTDITNVTAEAGKHTALTVDGQAPINTTYVGDNLKLNVTDNDGQKTYDLKLNDTLRIGGKDGQDGHMGINGADGKSGVGIDGKDGISIKGKDGKESVTIKGIDGVDGVDGAEGHIGLNGKDGMTDIWTKPGTPGLNGKDGETMTRIVYKAPQGQEHQAATLDDGLKFGGDSGTASAVKLNKQLNVTGGETDSSKLATGNNLGVVSSQDGENGKLEIKLAKDLTGLNSVTTGNTVVNNDGLTISSSAAGVTKTVKLGNQAGGGANAAEGNYLTGLDNKTWDAKNIASGRAATEDQLKAVAESIGTDVSGKTFGLADDANAAVSKTLGNTIQVKGDSKAISTSIDGDALKISLNDNITIGGKDGANGKDGHIGVDGKDGKDGADGYNGKDAVSIDGKDGNEGHIGLNGKDGKDGERGADGKNAYSDISTHFGPASLNDAVNVTMTDGTTKMTRLRYEDQNGYTHEVATMDDGQVYGGDTGTAFKRYLNQQANVKGGVTDESKLTTTDNIGVVSDGTDTLKVRLAKDLTGLDSVTTGNTVVNNSGITINNKVSLTDGGLDNGGNKITNVANGENDFDAVNYSQLKQVDQKAGKHTAVTVEGGTAAGTDTYAGSSLKLKATTTDGQTTYDLKLGDNLSIGGKDGADGKDGHIGVNGKDGVSGVGIDGKDGISIKGKDGKDGVTIKGIDGVDGVDGAEGHIGLNGKDGMTDIWTKPGAPGLNGKDGETMTRIVYKDPQGQEHQAATLDDGLKFGGDFGDASAVKLNKQVNVKGNARNEADLTDGNIGVVSSQDGANGQLLIKLNKDLDLTEQGSVKLGSVSLSGSGLNNGGQQITNVASGTSGKTWDATTQGYEATWNNGANIGDVKTAINDIKGADKGGFGLTADDGQSVKQDLGKTITVTGDKNIETKVSDGKLQIGLKKDVDLGPDGSIKTGDTTISKDGVETNKITIKDSSISISKDGIDAGNTVIKDVHSGIVNGDDTDNSNAANIGDVKKIAGDAAEGARAKSGKNITVKDDNTVNLNDKITLGDDTNKAQQVTIDGNGATVTAGDGDNQVKLDGSKGQITAGGATLGKQENTSGDKNPASGSYLTGLDNKTWDGEHIQSGRAATEDQLQVVDKKISGGRVFQGDDGKDNAVTVGLGDTMKLTGGADSANLTNGNIGVVRSSDGDGLEIKLSKNITGLDSVTTGNTTINNSGVTIKSSDSTKGGDIKIATGDVSMGGSQIHDVAPGSNGTDAVNVNQLSSAMNNVERNFTKLDARVNRAGANAAALAALHPLDFDPDDKLDVAAGTGHYNGANAVAIGAFYRPNEDTMISLGGSMGGGENMINAGVTFKLGQHNHVSTTRVAMAKEIKALKALVNQQYGEMQQMKQMVNQLAGKTALSVDTSALFPDIPQNHWAYEYVTKLAHSGILQGYPDGEFKGDRMMTRYEFATMLYRAIMGGAASNPDLNKDGTLDKLTKEFEPELKYIRIDVIQKDQDGVPTIERVRTTEAARYHRAGK
ncbi:ESPR-type extended signal peptide-containing protein [Acidaminococcus timonensis]|uniref:ESPR-type extended signal peptide-containing protein n=1 Tax=Acidaminococcus timonensis TaxID=1871002 RepID=UPI0026EDAA57|nr:ESPR-type extended signal peptide-containing protein [Acidaminococcus timonensis]